MAKARRSLGRNSVSVLDTRGQYSAEVKIDMSVPLSTVLVFYAPCFHAPSTFGLFSFTLLCNFLVRLVPCHSSSETKTGQETCTVFTRCGDLHVTESSATEGSLRQRGAALHNLEDDEVSLQAESDTTLRNDSLSLFAGLVPPPLRRSKKNFTSGKSLHLDGGPIGEIAGVRSLGIIIHPACPEWLYNESSMSVLGSIMALG